MAQGAVLLILFAFMMCLSCLSSSAVGSGVFYACSDGTMSPGEFDLKKCLNFGVSDVLSATGEITGLDASPEPESATTGELDSLIADRPEDADDTNPDNAYLDFFGTGETVRISGAPTLTSVSSKAECARICFNTEVPMRTEGAECNGFVSDGFSKCMLYSSSDTVAGSTLPSSDRSYRLKTTRSGEQPISFSRQNFNTGLVEDSRDAGSRANGDFGTPWAMGSNTDVVCEKGNKGILSGFRAIKQASKVGFRYSCLMSDRVSGDRSIQATSSTNQGQRNSCGGKQSGTRHTGSDIGFLNQHEVNCLDSFIYSWGVRPSGGWKNGTMKVNFTCTSLETPDSTGCEDLETSGDFGPRPCKLSNLIDSPVQCPANKALTRFRINDPPGKISYRCCPKPTEGSSTTFSRYNTT
jgi:hypothetical protein